MRHPRRSPRWPPYDYRREGRYFVTICTAGRQPVFGHIAHGRLVATPLGRAAHEEWARTLALRDELLPDAFVVMPNHVHLLFGLLPPDDGHARTDMINHVPTDRGRGPTDQERHPSDPPAPDGHGDRDDHGDHGDRGDRDDRTDMINHVPTDRGRGPTDQERHPSDPPDPDGHGDRGDRDDRDDRDDRTDMIHHVPTEHTRRVDHERPADHERHADRDRRHFGRPLARSVSSVVGTYKAAVTRRVRRAGLWAGAPLWQGRFHDRVVRDDAEADRVRRYIVENPARWDADALVPLPPPRRLGGPG